jgi:hypothetical protein
MDNLQKLQETADKVTDFQNQYNSTTKKIAYLIGKNLTVFICMLIPLLLIAFVWTDFQEIILDTSMIRDGILTVMLFAAGEWAMTRLGADGGKLDPEYIEAKGEFDNLLERAGELGTMLMGVFCDWQIDVELEQAVQFRRRMLKMPPHVWEDAKGKTYEELKALYGRSKARKIREIIELKPIELNEAILLYNGDYGARGGVPMSGDEYLKKWYNILEVVLACVFTGLFTVSVVISFTTDISIARGIYTVFKFVTLLTRMASGYSKGAKAYNTIEVRQFKAKSNYLKKYIKFLEDKIYLKLGNKYGDISCFVTELSTELSTESATTTVEK